MQRSVLLECSRDGVLRINASARERGRNVVGHFCLRRSFDTSQYIHLANLYIDGSLQN